MKEIYIERQENLLRAAVLEDGNLIECLIEENSREPEPGQIYKGIVKNIVPAIKCAFIDIGYEKNCYMYLDRKFNNLKIKKNDEVMVEILKGSVGEKGPKVTNAITIPGRYVVLETLNKDISFSKKIVDESFKASVRESIVKPEDIGVTIRTNAAKLSVDMINNEIKELEEIYSEIKRKSQYLINTNLLYNGEGIVKKLIRDIVDEETERIVVDNKEDFNHLKKFFQVAAELNCKVEFYNESRTLFGSIGIDNEILGLRKREVLLKEGGHLVIDKTEAMYVIDVNSGKNIKGSTIEKTALSTNLKAAEEIGRQVRLRNLSGIIVVDFIDMNNLEHKNKVMSTLKAAFKNDRSKVSLYPITQLNLVQIARERRGKPLSEYLEEKCSSCKGKGNILSLWYLEGLIRNEILKIAREYECKNIYLELDIVHKNDILSNVSKFIERIGGNDKSIYAKFVEETDYYKIEPMIFPNHIENMQKYKIYG